MSSALVGTDGAGVTLPGVPSALVGLDGAGVTTPGVSSAAVGGVSSAPVGPDGAGVTTFVVPSAPVDGVPCLRRAGGRQRGESNSDGSRGLLPVRFEDGISRFF